MEIANFLAEVWGMLLVIIPLSFLTNSKMMKELFMMAEKETAAYTEGVLSFFLGVATVLLNNVWAHDWMTIVTILGWLALLKGLFLMFWTSQAIAWEKKIKGASWFSYALLVSIVIGLALVYFGFVG